MYRSGAGVCKNPLDFSTVFHTIDALRVHHGAILALSDTRGCFRARVTRRTHNVLTRHEKMDFFRPFGHRKDMVAAGKQ
jgi:hypothetical protein